MLMIVLVCLLMAGDSRGQGLRERDDQIVQCEAIGQSKGHFDGNRAYDYLKKQTSLGPRAPGLPGHERCLKYLQGELKNYAERVELQQFYYNHPGGKRFALTNILASFNEHAIDRIVFSAHWDTRLWADKDPDARNHNKPIAGANDGASGVAVLLEIARQLKITPPPIGVDLLLFDGEDLGTTGKPESFSVGSRHFARNKPESFRPRFGINIDMVGDRELTIYREQNSERLAPGVQELVFSTAKELNITQFISSKGAEISDDHLPLNEVGIPTIDIIDFDYPDQTNRYWHTLDDTPDKCTPESLAAVGQVLMTILYKQR